MTEDIQIQLSTKLDSSGLDSFRKALNEQRNEINAVARETDKADLKYKQLKSTAAELNRIMKLSDTDLKKYAGSLIQTEQAVTKVSNAKGKLITNTDKLSKSFGTLKTNVGSYSTQIVSLTGDIARGDSTMLQSIGTLGLYAGGWFAVASGIFLATKNLVEWMNTESKNINNQDKKGALPNSVPGDFNFNTPTSKYFPETALSLLPSKEGFLEYQKYLASKTSSNSGTFKQVKIENAVIDKIEKATAYFPPGGGMLTFANIEASDISTSNNGINIPRGIFGGQPMPIQDTSRDTLADIQTGFSLIGQTMSLLNVSSHTFAGTLINAFSFATNAMQLAGGIFSFLGNFIPGLGAIGSALGGGDSMRTNTNGDSMRYFNNNVNNNINRIYVSSNVNDKYFRTQIEKYNSSKTYKIV